MADFLTILIRYHRKNKLRAENFYFMKACMAAAAIVAKADGVACRKEALAAKSLMKILENLQIFDPRHGSEVYGSFLEKLEKDRKKGLSEALKAIGPIRNDTELTQLLVMLCHTISEADGIVRPEEVDAIEEICKLLDIDAKAVKAVEIDLREQLLD